MKGVYIVIKNKNGEVVRGSTISISSIEREVVDALENDYYVQIHTI